MCWERSRLPSVTYWTFQAASHCLSGVLRNGRGREAGCKVWYVKYCHQFVTLDLRELLFEAR